MKTFNKYTLGSLLCFIFSAESSASSWQNCTRLAGKWGNQIGSTFTIQHVNPETGALIGTYKSPSGTKGETYPVSGWINGAKPSGSGSNVPVITFSVRWGEYGSVASWAGYCEEKKGTPTITTLWHLVRPNANYSWDHVYTNSDVFKPME